MDLLRNMMEKRASMAQLQSSPLVKYEPRRVETERKKTKAEKAKEHIPGTKSMRRFIQEERPSIKVVREHFKALMEDEESSSDEE
jgi:hypothetical protein